MEYSFQESQEKNLASILNVNSKDINGSLNNEEKARLIDIENQIKQNSVKKVSFFDDQQNKIGQKKISQEFSKNNHEYFKIEQIN